MDERLYAGIDGGGTKTKLAIYTHRGNKVCEYSFTGCNINQIGVEEFNSVMDAIDHQLKKHEIKNLVFGVPGYGESQTTDQTIEQKVAKMSVERFTLYNDVDIAQFGASRLSNGIHIVAGTGSIIVKLTENERKRCGGYGPLIGDEGSGYWIGYHALNAISKQFEGRGPESTILKRLKQLSIVDEQSLIDYVYLADNSRVAIARVSEFVDIAASVDGDDLARDILIAAASELVELVKPLLEAEENQIITYSGSVFNSCLLSECVAEQLSRCNCKLTKPYASPVQGAVLQAMKLGDENVAEIRLEDV